MIQKVKTGDPSLSCNGLLLTCVCQRYLDSQDVYRGPRCGSNAVGNKSLDKVRWWFREDRQLIVSYFDCDQSVVLTDVSQQLVGSVSRVHILQRCS